MILMFDYFETLVHSKTMDFNRGLKPMWETYYKEACSFEKISAYGEELFEHMQEAHKKGLEYAFIKDELPLYASKYGGASIEMTAKEEADFLMRCNDMECMEHVPEALTELENRKVPMYVLSNSGFTGEALLVVLERLGMGRFFKKLWSSADYGRIKPDRGFFEMAIQAVLQENPGEKRESILFVGDTYRSDVVGANGAGLDVVWLNSKGKPNTEKLPIYNIADMSELLECVKDRLE